MAHEKIWIVKVTRETGWGASSLYLFHDGDKAVKKFYDICDYNNLDIVGILGNIAVSNTETKNHIDRVDIFAEYTLD